jgi:hypothetical protein
MLEDWQAFLKSRFRQQPLATVIFSIVFLSVLIFYNTLWGRFFDIIGIAAAAMAFWYAFINFRASQEEKERLDQKITIHFQNLANGDIYDLPFRIRRGNFSRAELFGYIGLVPLKDKEKTKFSPILYTSTEAFLDYIDDVQQGEATTINIKCTEEEYGQFDFAAIGIKKDAQNEKENYE